MFPVQRVAKLRARGSDKTIQKKEQSTGSILEVKGGLSEYSTTFNISYFSESACGETFFETVIALKILYLDLLFPV